jgi:hypothetical protein
MDAPDQEPSLVPGITLADYVIRDAGSGKLSLIGCFGQFNFPKFPLKMGRFFVVSGITNLHGSIEKMVATCRIEMAGSGHVVGSSTCEIRFGSKNPPLQPRVIFDLAFPFEGCLFVGAGPHDVVVLVNNEVIGTRTIMVSQVTAPAAPPENP